jgi:hypothetical protein
MATYRLYCLDAVGRIAHTRALEASSDQEAVELARQHMAAAARCEVWLSHRMIAKIDGPDPLQQVSQWV